MKNAHRRLAELERETRRRQNAPPRITHVVLVDPDGIETVEYRLYGTEPGTAIHIPDNGRGDVLEQHPHG